MKLSELKGQGTADRATGSFADLLDNIKRIDAEESARESALPQWNVIVWDGGVAVKSLRRSFSVPYLLEKIAQELDADECADDRVLERITISIERVKE